jgi:ABC-2 type transport system ATP-binding protein
MPGSENEYKYWGRCSSTHDSDVAYIVGHRVQQEIKDWLINQFRDTDVVLEFGCGTGFYSEVIADRVKRLTATDLAQEMIEQAEERLSQYSNVDVQMGDSYDTLFKDSLSDAVLMTNLLHIVKDPIVVLRESHRVLKSDGRIVIADYTGYGMPFLRKMGLGIRYMRKFGKPAPYNKSFNPDELAGIVRQAGFVVEESRLVGTETKAVCLRGKKVG